MNTHKSTLFSSIVVTLTLAVMLVVQPLHLFPTAQAQDTVQEENGFTNRALDNRETEASFDKFSEALDAKSIEADPTAPDDRDTSSTGQAAAPYQIPVPLKGGLDHVANGVGTRNSRSNTIRLRGVPPGSTAVRAFLYWGTLQAAATPAQTVIFRGSAVTGTLIGSAAPTCWGAGVFAAYRASVIALINPGINGDYVVTGMPTSLFDGRDPWSGPAPLPLSEGASLVVVYANSSVPVTAQVFINNGAAFFFNVININNPLAGVLNPYSRLKHTRLGADGQVGFSTSSSLPVTNERTFIGPPFFTQIKGSLSPFNGDSDWNGDDGAPLNQLWDTHTDSFGQILNPGIANYVVRYTAQGDCIFAVAHILSTR
ncbi:MAG TPA: hypothetical protein VM934_07885 [Pyrinomonadaceae bacterium]|nr:hypothetical protein [Pyrinomonadaceae bacterium]